jgi:hypothetical protein
VGNVGGEYDYWLLEGNESSAAGGFPSNLILVWVCAEQVHKHEFFILFFCRNQNLMVPRACNTRFLKIVFDSVEIFDF